MMAVSPEKEKLDEVDVLTSEEKNRNLVLFNDDFNTFDFVIESLIEVCDHEVIQAEQCTFIVHYVGKCEVKTGSYSFLDPMRIALIERGLSAVIE
jgi:ATP-dependent Clp protease adaptor protein ClpS